MHRARLPRGLRSQGVPPHGHRLRHPAAEGLVESQPPRPSPSSRRAPRPRSAITTRTSASSAMARSSATRPAAELRDKSLAVYSAARDHAASRGIIIADTKFEFGVIDGKITLVDEVLTPGLEPLLARRHVRARQEPAELRQAVRARLARGERLGQDPAAARAPRRRPRRRPRRSTSRPMSSSPAARSSPKGRRNLHMARRSPNNARYQKYTGPEGKTRKSAAAAKPKKRRAPGQVERRRSRRSSSKSRSAPRRSAMRNPDTPEFNACRRSWWIALGVGGLRSLHRSRLLRPAALRGRARGRERSGFILGWRTLPHLRVLHRLDEDAPAAQGSTRQPKSGKAPKPRRREAARRPTPRLATTDVEEDELRPTPAQTTIARDRKDRRAWLATRST